MQIRIITYLTICFSLTVFAQKNISTSFSTLTKTIYRTPIETRIDSNDLNSYVKRFSKGFYDVLENPKMQDSGYIYIYGSLERIAEEYRFNPNVLALMLKISDVMNSNAEFSESMPSFIQRALIIQPELFLSQLFVMNTNKQSMVIDLVTFTRTKNVKSVLRRFISDSTNVHYNKLAKTIIKKCE
jgi:hypothetical protein